MMGFEAITLAPYARNLINTDLLTADELDWVNAYLAKVQKEIGPRLADYPKTQAWLEHACAPF